MIICEGVNLRKVKFKRVIEKELLIEEIWTVMLDNISIKKAKIIWKNNSIKLFIELIYLF